jgi:hypothetical protein
MAATPLRPEQDILEIQLDVRSYVGHLDSSETPKIFTYTKNTNRQGRHNTIDLLNKVYKKTVVVQNKLNLSLKIFL